MGQLRGRKTVETPTPEQVAQAIKGANQIAATKDKERPLVLGKQQWKKWTPIDVLPKLAIAQEDIDRGEVLMRYLAVVLPEMQSDALDGRASGIQPWDYITGSIENAINDGAVEWDKFSSPPAVVTPPATPPTKPKKPPVDTSEDDQKEQEIVEVSQEQVKEALRILLTRKSEITANLYEKHTEYNGCHFCSELSTPIITIDKLNNKTLANYTEGKDGMELEHHIRFNHNFIALNEPERIYETLIHEMIHQWQDEVLYAPDNATHMKKIKMPQRDEDGKIVYVEGFQKKRPKEWHNKDFKDMAAICGIPAKGTKCFGSPSNMPVPQSYNRKYMCGCVADNGYPVSIWSTQEIKAICQRCLVKGRSGEFVEVSKKDPNARTITIKFGVEIGDQDIVHDTMTAKYQNFMRFDTKLKKDDFIDRLNLGDIEEHPVVALEQGVYQKNNNAYKKGDRYWIAYSTAITADSPTKEDIKEAAKDKAKGKGGASKVDKPKDVEKTSEPKPRAKILKFPTDPPVEPPAPKPEPIVERTYSVDNPQDILDLYATPMTVKQIGAKLGVAQSTVSARVKKFKINFNTMTFEK